MNELIDEMIKEFEESKGGSTSFIFDDGDEYHTDTGYAMEGINAFTERLKKRLISMTNGDMIKAMFKFYRVVEDKTVVYVYTTENDFRIANNQMGFDADWWNASYNGEVEE